MKFLNKTFLTALLLTTSFLSQTSSLHFNRLSVDDGLSQGSVFDILQDRYGFMWFATSDGMNKYDGYTFEVYSNNPHDSTSLPNNYVTSFDEDSNGDLWVGTKGGGLAKFNLNTEKFKRIPLSKHYPKADFSIINEVLVADNGVIWVGTKYTGLCSYNPANDSIKIYTKSTENEVLSIYEDKKGNIWFGTLFNGAFQLDPITGEIRHYLEDEYDGGAQTVFSITEDKNGTIWFGTFQGLRELDKETGKIKRHLIFDILGKDYPYEKIRSIITDNNNNLWVATSGAGLVKLHIPTMEFSNYKNIPADRYSISYNTVISLFIDKTGALWTGTHGKGINVVFPFNKNFISIGDNSKGQSNIDFSSIRAILSYNNNSFWIGGYGGLILYNKKKGVQFSAPYSGTRSKVRRRTNYLINQTVYSLLKDPLDPEKYLWIGLEGGGLSRYNLETKQFLNFFVDGPATNEVTGSQIYELVKGPNNQIWAGSYQGLTILDPKTLSRKFYKHDPNNLNSLPEGKVIAIYFDQKNRCWIGTDIGGFSIYNPSKDEFTNYKANPGKQNWLLSNTVYSFLEDSKGRFWLTTGYGLYLFSPEKEKFKVYTEKDGLPNDIVYSILEDDSGLLWLSTNNGLSQFDPTDNVFSNYTVSNGLQGNEFNSGAYYKEQNGILYFGGTRGVTYFNPIEIRQNHYPPTVVLTEITIMSDKIRKIVHPEELKLLELRYDDDIVTFEFSALNYQSPQLNQYMYKVEGLNKNWVELGKKRTVTFTDLPAGKYLLHIIASNNDDVWNEEGLQLAVIINPPFWSTWWFILSSILLIALIIVGGHKYRVSSMEKQKITLESLVKERTADLQKSRAELEKVNNAKDKLLSIIAHDMKNPFNSLLGYSEMLVKDFDSFTTEEKKEALSGMATTSKAAYNLLENLLDWSRLQMSKIDIEKKQFHINELIEQNLHLTSIPLANKQITIKKDLNERDKVYADEYMLNTVIRNLLMNSIKFTNDRGEITLSSSIENNHLKINVIDNGIGMSAEQKDILLRLDKVKTSMGTSGEKGTGLGIILCKEFIETNNGKLQIESKLDKGSTFSFTVPLA